MSAALFFGLIISLPGVPAQSTASTVGTNVNVTATSNSTANLGGILGGMGSVQGHYVDNKTGMQIDFPSGWSGYNLLGLAVVAPGGLNSNLSKPTNPSGVEMVVISVDASMMNQSSVASFNATSVATTSACPNSQISFTSVNDIPAYHFIGQGCQSLLLDQKIDGYFFFTNNGIDVGVVFIANNTSLYDKYSGDFQNSITSVQLDNSQDIMTAIRADMHLKSNFEPVKLQSNNQTVAIDSSSDISDFKFSDANKSLSFTVSGAQGSTGNTYVNIGNLLQGPYTVTLDGSAIPFATIKDESTGDVLISIQYHHSSHAVTITGASVVPEIPIALLPLAAGIMGLIAFRRLNSN